LAVRFHWSEAQVDASDPDLIDELLTFIRAENDHAAFVEKQRDAAKR
jgi:hypothetical protein